MQNLHTFHIPVMGLGYTVDTPAKVASLGISSSISLVDDFLIEKMREFYCKKYGFEYIPIERNIDDGRAKRITEYLNIIGKVVEIESAKLISSIETDRSETDKYFSLLPDYSTVKKEYFNLIEKNAGSDVLLEFVKTNCIPGSIDVNIMTKLDRENYLDGVKLPSEQNDAHSALRGFANSNLESSLILSAGMNPKLYSYLESFDDFYPDIYGKLKKKIILKISDYRSALIQSKYLAKKGIWISEYRVESGLNCGGHAFAKDGVLMGPILEELSANRKFLQESTFEILVQALKAKNRPVPSKPLPLMLTAQGGVGTSLEHEFLLKHYNLDSVGWGTPFLLVPEATNVDPETLSLLAKAGENDLYLSNISPMGIPFNSVRGNSKNVQKRKFAEEGKPGNVCKKKFLMFNTEFTEIVICTASRQYQKMKINELKEKNLPAAEFEKQYEKIIEKECLCEGLAESALVNISDKHKNSGVTVCPGPNLAYFSDVVSLKQMIDHIYGRINIIRLNFRPHMFIKEVSLYIDYFKNNLESIEMPVTQAQIKQLVEYKNNVMEGINYYKKLFLNTKYEFENAVSGLIAELEKFEKELSGLAEGIPSVG